MRLWRKARSLARLSRQPSRIEAWSPESATTVSPGPRIVPERAHVGLVAGGEDDRAVGPHPVGDLLLELEVQRRRAVEQARAGQAGAVALQGVAGALHDALVAREAEVVVGAQHDPRGALHLHDGARGPLDRAEVGEDVGLARRAQQRRRARCRGPWRRRRSRSRACRVRRRVRGREARQGPQGAARVHRAPVPAALYLAVLVPPAAPGAPAVPQPPPERLLQARRRAAVLRLARRARGRAHQRADRPRLQRLPGQPLGDVRLPGVRGRPGDPARAARGRGGLAARARPRPDDRADGLRRSTTRTACSSRATSASR